MNALADYLLTRQSPAIPMLREPGPGPDEIETMIRIAARVPDHGKLQPWRFILYRGEARHRVVVRALMWGLNDWRFGDTSQHQQVASLVGADLRVRM